MAWLTAAPPDEIVAGPVRLRRWRAGDAGLLVRLVTDNQEHLRPWMPWAQQPPTAAEEREFLERMDLAWERRSDFAYGLVVPEAGTVGGLGLHTRQGEGILEIGYWIAAASSGRGYVTAAARALTDAAFALPGVDRVEIRCDEANRPSAAVPRRLGYRLQEVYPRQAVAPGETGMGMIWVVERDEWPKPGPDPGPG